MPVVVILYGASFAKAASIYPKSIAAALICPAGKSYLPVLPDSMFKSRICD